MEPVASIARSNANSREMGALINAYLQVNPIQKLTLRTQFGTNARFRRSDSFTPEFRLHEQEQQQLNEVSRQSQEWFDWNWTNTITYADTFAEKHNFNAMAGFTAERYAWYNTKALRRDLPSNDDIMQEVDAGNPDNVSAEGTTTFNTMVSFLGRVMYNYANKYYITLHYVLMVLHVSQQVTNMRCFHLLRLHGELLARNLWKIRKYSPI